MSRDIFIKPNRGATGPNLYPEIAFSGTSSATPIKLKVDDDGSVLFTGTYGVLFNISDNKDGLLHSVNDISGLPILSVYSYDYVQMGKWDKNTLVVNSDLVGVGLTAPSTKFHIYATSSGAFRLQDGTETNGYVLTSDANGVATWAAGGGSGNGATASGTTNFISKFTGTNILGDSLIFDSGTNVGIGTTSPLAKLHVDGGAGSNVQIYIKSTGNDNGIQIDSGQYPFFTMKSNGVANVTLQGAGSSIIFRPAVNVEWRAVDSNSSMFGSINMDVAANSYSYYNHSLGIGISTPTNKLHVYATQSGAFRLQDTTQGAGKVLTSDANGVGTWASIASVGIGTTNKSTTTRGFTASITETITHNLNTTDVIVQNYDSTGLQIIAGSVLVTGTGSVDITFSQTLSNVKTILIG